MGSSDFLDKAGSVMASGSALPVSAIGSVLIAGAASRTCAARCYGVHSFMPVLAPSPQFGVLGFVHMVRTEEPSPSRTASLTIALSGPLAMAFVSLGLLICGCIMGSDSEVLLQNFEQIAWPLGVLPQRCD